MKLTIGLLIGLAIGTAVGPTMAAADSYSLAALRSIADSASDIARSLGRMEDCR